MSNTHNYSFFGKNTGMMIQSSSREDPFIFLRCILKKENGDWEKPSRGEGKNVKFSLEEIILMLQVLRKEVSSWSTYHSFKENSTQISFKWKNGDFKELYINIDNYPKMLTYAQIEILRLLLEHLLHEKIKYATGSSKTNSQKEPKNNKIEIPQLETPKAEIPKQIPPKPEIIKEPVVLDKQTEISGLVKGETEKALFLKFSDEKEAWIPKSTLHNEYNMDKTTYQRFLIDTWVLKKNSVIA